MAKRGRASDRLTGGTQDVNPQILTSQRLTVPVGGNISNQEVDIILPINRFSPTRGRSIIVEILKVFWDLDSPTGSVGLSGSSTQIGRGFLSTSRFMASTSTPLNHEHPSIFAEGGWNQRIHHGTSAESWATMMVEPIVSDLTDGAGHGFLVATDRIWLTGQTVGQNINAVDWHVSVKILYRFKEVALEEYIGIVQGQSLSS